MRKKRRFFLPEILLCLLVLGLWAYHSYTKPTESTKYLNTGLFSRIRKALQRPNTYRKPPASGAMVASILASIYPVPST